ncbi:ankyrin repeat domain-containing protein [soil metagenome]
MTLPPEPDDTPAAIEQAVADLAVRLLDAARMGDAAVLAAYVDAGAPVDLVADTGDSLLMLAAYHGHADAVAALLQRGADTELANAKGQTPLAGAVFKGYTPIVVALVAAGADPDAGQPSARAAAVAFDRPDLLDLLA